MKKKFNVIAEIGSNHNKSLKRCYQLISHAKKLDCFAVKFQLFKLENLFHQKFIKKNKKTLIFKKFELPLHFIPKLYRYCKNLNIKFMCTPFDLASLDKISNYVDYIKIASYELLWDELLIKAAQTKKTIIISTGMATVKEITKAINILKKNKAKKIIILHCVSSYPADCMETNLNSFKFLKKKYKLEIGWSDHSVDELLIYKIYKDYNISLFELHFDLDGKGWESKMGKHCWTYDKLKNLKRFIQNEKQIEGKFTKSFSIKEKKERLYRADPSDGLRPRKIMR